MNNTIQNFILIPLNFKLNLKVLCIIDFMKKKFMKCTDNIL
jgi:hypothetical protein